MFLWATALVVLGLWWAARRSRQRFVDDGDVFRCRVRAVGRSPAVWSIPTRRWTRRMWALWSDDVLVLRRGPILTRTIALQVTVCSIGVYVLPRCDTRGRAAAIAVCLRLPDGARIEVAAVEQERVTMVGPYLAAAINDLPTAPVPRRPV
jgi:hypothetical protein